MSLANNLKKLLESNNLSESALSRNSGIKQPLIHRLISGENINPTLNTLQIIAHYFSISISQLVGEEQLAVSVSKNISTNINTWYPIPIIEENSLLNNDDASTEYKKQIMIDHLLSDKAFAIQYNEKDMEPAIPKNSIIVIDPMIIPSNQDFVLIKNLNKLLIKYCIRKENDNLLLSGSNIFDTIEESISVKDNNILGTIVRVIYGRRSP